MKVAWRALLQRVIAYFRRSTPAKAAKVEPVLTALAVDPEPACEAPKPPGPDPVVASERLRRRLERARRRYDVFVEPKDAPPKKAVVHPQPKPRRPKPKPVEEEPSPVAGDIIAETTSRGDEVLIEETEIYGEFNFRDTILNQLDRYFIYLRRMKKRDPDAWGFYKQVGATLAPLAALGMTDLQFRGKSDDEDHEILPKFLELPAWFKSHRPAFGCVAFGTTSVLEKTEQDYLKTAPKKWTMSHPRFLYYRKYSKPPPEVQLANGGDVYSLTIFWDRVDAQGQVSANGGVPQNYFLAIDKDGHVQLLKVLESALVKIYGKRTRRGGKRGRKHYGAEFRQSSWVIPNDLVELARYHKASVQDYLIKMFCDIVKQCEYANYSMLRVAVSRGDMVATFGVAHKRIGYFFQDRDVQLNEGGIKRRIFHLVRAHKRVVGDHEVVVPFHFRGLREFSWAGYQVKITVPGRDHFMLPEFNVGMNDEYWMDRKEKVITEPHLAEHLVKWMDDGVGGIHRDWNTAKLTSERKAT